ncbi:MAG: peptidoglycan editing factor PgeF [Bdellovibrionales bacterium]|nr:peptidoglycan editing factor PgeF [Bdellovibrionales bacterium]
MILQDNVLFPNWSQTLPIFAYTFFSRDMLPTDLPEPPRIVKQIHSNQVICWDHQPFSPILQADAFWTTRSNTVCAVQTADCLPIVITNSQAGFVATIHAGWRGLAQKIITHTLQELPSDTSDFLVWIGPAIGPKHFVVMKDVYEAFSFKPAFEKIDETHWQCDLIKLAKTELEENGINPNNISGGSWCTYSTPNLPSYRRDKENAGRMVTFAYKTK